MARSRPSYAVHRPCLLDRVGAKATTAYGLRRLRQEYRGPAIRVRRSSDNVEIDIGFRQDDTLDIGGLISFVGSGSGFITRLYDQSGNGNNATQGTTTRQPAIITSGVLNTIGGKPAMKSDGSDDRLALTTAFATTLPQSSFAVAQNSAAGTSNTIHSRSASNTGAYQLYFSSTNAGINRQNQAGLVTKAAASGGVNHCVVAVCQSTGTIIAVEGSEATNATAPGFTQTVDNIFGVNSNASAEPFGANFAELCHFAGQALTLADRQLLAGNAGQYYGIPLA